MWAAFHLELCGLEPGYYEDGAFGIRIENVVLVVPAKTKVSAHIICLKISCCYYGKTNAFESWWGQNGAFSPRAGISLEASFLCKEGDRGCSSGSWAGTARACVPSTALSNTEKKNEPLFHSDWESLRIELLGQRHLSVIPGTHVVESCPLTHTQLKTKA